MQPIIDQSAVPAKNPVTREARPWMRALAWLAFLGPFFFLTYGFANNWAAHLPHVGSVVFAWERHIPFLPWTILPYMSIDAFYAVSLFLCATRVELDAHAKRLLMATLISVTCFLLFPLQFTLARPPTDGFNGTLFAVLTGFDKPFNQAPSLHISLLVLLWVIYARHLCGLVRWLMHGWFFLIGISVFTTYQHHVIDGVTGLLVGVICLYLFPDQPRKWAAKHDERSTDPIRYRLSRWYALAGLACLSIACLEQGWAWLAMWPGLALMLVSLAYYRLDVSIFQKHEGRHHWPARILLAPYSAGAWLSSRWFTRNGLPNTEIIHGIGIGRAPGPCDWRHFQANSVLDLTAEFHAGSGALRRCYVSVPMLDLIAPSPAQLATAVNMLDALHAEGPVLVHCALGYSRSAVVIVCWLLYRGFAASVPEAVEKVRAARPRIVLPPAYMAVIEEFQRANASRYE